MTPLEKAWAAVLTLSIEDAAKGPTEQELADYTKVRIEDARAWFDSDSEEPGTFLWVCNMLGLEAAGVRKEVNRRRKEARK